MKISTRGGQKKGSNIPMFIVLLVTNNLLSWVPFFIITALTPAGYKMKPEVYNDISLWTLTLKPLFNQYIYTLIMSGFIDFY